MKQAEAELVRKRNQKRSSSAVMMEQPSEKPPQMRNGTGDHGMNFKFFLTGLNIRLENDMSVYRFPGIFHLT